MDKRVNKIVRYRSRAWFMNEITIPANASAIRNMNVYSERRGRCHDKPLWLD